MTTITPATGTATVNTASGGANPSMISADFQTFLTMLTAQMQNQDPLNPIESSDYAVQLATFSGVEQQVRTNTLLESLASQMGVMGMSQLAGWVGMEARAAVPAYFDGGRVTLAPNPVQGADQTVLVAYDENGREVLRKPIAASAEQFEWDGTDQSGGLLPHGLYRFELENYNSGTPLETIDVEVYGRIVEAQGTSNGTMLVLEGGTKIGTADVTALREGG